MSWKHVTIERRGRVAVVRFDRQDGRNAMSRALMRELFEAARSFEEDDETSAIVLTGAADVFTMGFDLRDPSLPKFATAGLSERRRSVQIGPRLCRAWEDLAPFTIVAIEGYCIGGGMALSVACDFRVCGANATLYVPEINRGMNMSWQSLPRFVNLVGPARAKQIVILAEKIAAEQALAWGLVQEVVPAGTALDRALALAERAAAMPPLPVRMTKQAINAAATALNHSASYMDADQYVLCQTGEDFKEGVAAFLEKRPPRFTGR